MEIDRSQIDYNFSDLLLTILSVLLAIIFGLIPLYQWLYRKYILKSTFTFDILNGNNTSRPHADYMPVDPYINPIYDTRNAPQTFTYEWNYKIIITNNSVYDAFFPELEFIGDLSKFSNIHKLDRNQPIASRKRVEIPVRIVQKEIVSALDRKNMNDVPIEIQKIKILLSFENGYSKRRFHTLYDNMSNTTLNSIFKPKI